MGKDANPGRVLPEIPEPPPPGVCPRVATSGPVTHPPPVGLTP